MTNVVSHVLSYFATPSSQPAFLSTESALSKIALAATGVIALAGTTFLIAKTLFSEKSVLNAQPLDLPTTSFWKTAGKILFTLGCIASVLVAIYFLFGPLGLTLTLIFFLIIVGFITKDPFWIFPLLLMK